MRHVPRFARYARNLREWVSQSIPLWVRPRDGRPVLRGCGANQNRRNQPHRVSILKDVIRESSVRLVTNHLIDCGHLATLFVVPSGVTKITAGDVSRDLVARQLSKSVSETVLMPTGMDSSFLSTSTAILTSTPLILKKLIIWMTRMSVARVRH